MERALLQSPPDSTVRIVVSARTLAGDRGDSLDWLHRLDWSQNSAQSIRVPPLSREGIGEALRSMGYPVASLATRIDVIGVLERLTEGGDPLLVRMYAESLWNTGETSQTITPEELEKFDPGFGGFFKNWFEKQSGNWSDADSPFRGQLEAVLAVLSVALGPMEHRHLEAICKILTKDRVGSLSVKDIEPIRRFLLGDGREEGYSFQHPRFATYFKNEHFLGGSIITNAECAITAWSRDIVDGMNKGGIKPEKVPAYVLDNYTSHLINAADDPVAMELLLSEGWQRAWFEQDGGYARYAADIATLMNAFHHVSNLDPATRLALRLRCGLILSSIRSIGVNTPSELLAALVRHGKMSGRQALHRLQFQDAMSVAHGLPLIFDVADPVTKTAILTAAEGISSDNAKAGALGSLAERLPEPRRTEILERALTAAEGIGDDGDKAHALGSLAERLPERLLERALTAAEGIGSDDAKAGALGSLAERLPERLLERALTAAEGIGNDGAKAGALGSLAERLPERLLERALTAAEGIGNDGAKAGALGSLAERLPERLLERALTAAEGIGDDDTKAGALGSLAERLPERLLERALTAAEGIGNDGAKAGALGSLAERLPERLLERALTAAEGIGERRHQGPRARLTGRAPAGAAPDRDTGAGADGGRGDRQ